MNTRYIESYEVANLSLGIEDYEDGQPLKDHFFGEVYRHGKSKRFRCWSGGCGIGQANTLEEAREHIRQYAVRRLEERIKEAQKTLQECQPILDRLISPNVLAPYKEPADVR